MAQPKLTEDTAWHALNQVMDPEIPVISLVEMGIIRQVEVAEDGVVVKMTPTFSGCPALQVMQQDISDKLVRLGADQVTVDLVLSPPWSSDWISDTGREKLRQFGLAPPPKHRGNLQAVAFLDVAVCPRCSSTNTVIKNSFGPTLCRMIWYCNECRDAFEQFKPL